MLHDVTRSRHASPCVRETRGSVSRIEVRFGHPIIKTVFALFVEDGPRGRGATVRTPLAAQRSAAGVRSPAFVLQIAVAALFLGRAWQHLRWDAPYWALIHHERWLSRPLAALGIRWEDWAKSTTLEGTVETTILVFGVILLLGAFSSLIPLGAPLRWARLQRVVVGACAAILLLLTWCTFLDGKGQVAQLMELALQSAAPLCLIGLSAGISKRHIARVLRWAVALTFAGHGAYALGLYETPGVFLAMVMNTLGCSQQFATSLLQIAGILDGVVAASVLTATVGSKLDRVILGYAALWGTATALARVTSFVPLDSWAFALPQWWHQSVLRLIHGLGPLLILCLGMGATAKDRRLHRTALQTRTSWLPPASVPSLSDEDLQKAS